jgi:hypothetical protein
MFAIEQIKAAHSKVKSGADFLNYVQDLIKLGITSYETLVLMVKQPILVSRIFLWRLNPFMQNYL